MKKKNAQSQTSEPLSLWMQKVSLYWANAAIHSLKLCCLYFGSYLGISFCSEVQRKTFQS